MTSIQGLFEEVLPGEMAYNISCIETNTAAVSVPLCVIENPWSACLNNMLQKRLLALQPIAPHTHWAKPWIASRASSINKSEMQNEPGLQCSMKFTLLVLLLLHSLLSGAARGAPPIPCTLFFVSLPILALSSPRPSCALFLTFPRVLSLLFLSFGLPFPALAALSVICFPRGLPYKRVWHAPRATGPVECLPGFRV